MPYHIELFLLTTFTSMIAGVLGIGGGLLLIAVLPSLVPTAAIVPLHSAAQLVSNASRALFAFPSVVWRQVPRFLAGSLLGIAVFGALLYHISTDAIPLFIGTYILLTVWSRRFGRLLLKYENYFLVGFLQTGLGLVVGATGPLSITALMKNLGDKEKVVAQPPIEDPAFPAGGPDDCGVHTRLNVVVVYSPHYCSVASQRTPVLPDR
ncbi:MAG: TSUP family transporter [Gammaproteobacteria bacterium]